MFPNRIRYFNKRFLNRFMLKFVVRDHKSFAIVHHVGRRSGKTYETPIMVEPIEEGFLIALTYGPHVDWYRNLLAAGQGELVWEGKTYTIGKPEPVDQTDALPHYPLHQQVILRLFAVQHFVRVKGSVVEPVKV